MSPCVPGLAMGVLSLWVFAVQVACLASTSTCTNDPQDDACDMNTSLLQGRFTRSGQHSDKHARRYPKELRGLGAELLEEADSKAHNEDVTPITISEESGRAKVFAGGQPLGDAGRIRGASGFSHVNEAKALGADALRTWSYGQWQWAFKGASKHGLRVSAGIDLTHDRIYYTEEENCRTNSTYWTTTLKKVLNHVSEYKSNPALLWWTVGNECEEQVDWASGNDCLWKRIEQFAAEIKKIDAAHPVGTVIGGIAEGKVQSIKKLCPSLDFLGINVYGDDAPGLWQRLQDFKWTKPYAIMEYGGPGWWAAPKTSWGARLETMTSKMKAPFFTVTYQECVNSDMCLGSMAFLWGWKWEKTGTWFGLFDQWEAAGAQRFAVDTIFQLGKLWNPSSSLISPVSISSILVLAEEGPVAPFIGFSASPGSTVQIDVDVEGEADDVRWVVTPEIDSATSGNVHEDSALPIDGVMEPCPSTKPRRRLRALLDTSKLDTSNTVSYRLYAFVRSFWQLGIAESSASIPFLVGTQKYCHTAEPGEKCYDEVLRVKTIAERNGVCTWPAAALLPSSSFEEFQASLHEENQGNCSAPCSPRVLKGASVSCEGPALTTTTTQANRNCHDATPESVCYKAVDWAMKIGIKEHPEWYPGLTPESSFKDVQFNMYAKSKYDCNVPCEMVPSSSPTALPQMQPLPVPTPRPRALTCDAAPGGSKCYTDVQWAMSTGINEHPQWYQGLTKDSPFEAFQLYLHKQNRHVCGFPCALTTTTTTLPCKTAEAGSDCLKAINWAMETGIKEHPNWYPGLTQESSVSEFQLWLHNRGLHGCGVPCMGEPSSEPTSSPSFVPTSMPQDTPEPTASPSPVPTLMPQDTLEPTATATLFPCTDAQPGSQCYEAVNWAKNTGIKQHPKWYPGLTPESSFRDIQLNFHSKGKNGCHAPCVFAVPRPRPRTDPSPTPRPTSQSTPEPTRLPGQLSCDEAREGSECYRNVKWAMETGISQHPKWYRGLTKDSPFEAVQQQLHQKGGFECGFPCALTTSTTTSLCRDAAPGSTCYKNVKWAMDTGFKQNPQWYPGLSSSSSFQDFQQRLYSTGGKGCDAPCSS